MLERRYEPDDRVYFTDELTQQMPIEGLPLPEGIPPDTEASVVQDNDSAVVDVTIPGYPLDIVPVPRYLIRPND